MAEALTLEIDVLCEDPRWEEAGLDEMTETALRATLGHLGLGNGFELSVLGCDDARIAGLNAEFRGKPAATNVLSWPAEERAADTPGARPEPPAEPELGDIAIAYETCRKEADSQRKPFRNHVLHLVCHAVLHCLGYDHIDDADATLMEDTERAILASLGVPDPYDTLTRAPDAP